MRRLVPLCLVCALLLAACGDGRAPVRIGSHDFTEQRLLGEMMALLAEEADVPVERAIPYGDNRKSLEAIQRGVIDAYPEYDGTLLALSGVPPRHGEEGMAAAVRELLAPLGLRWLDHFGLEDGFVLAVRRDFAIRAELDRISDLARLERPLRFAADAGYLARPVDGLYALARRYGLTISAVETFPVGERDLVYDALADQVVDVAVAFSTDSRLDDYGVVRLRDDLGFFPDYHPAPLVRAAALAAYPRLAPAWETLSGEVGTEAMRQLIGRVERGGEDYRDVARSFLESLGLLPPRPSQAVPRGIVTLAVSPMADLGYLPIRAADAIREVMPARRLQVEEVDRPAEAVRSGAARFGLVGAEELYRLAPDGALTPPAEIEALGVVGNRFAHVIARFDASRPADWQRIGTGPPGSSSRQLARLALDALGRARQVELIEVEDPERLASMLADGEIDALMVMAEQGHAGLLQLLQDRRLRLVDLPAFRGDTPALRYPFLRPARIPPDAYPGQGRAVETVTAQAVLASRVPPQTDLLGESGPGVVAGVFTRLPQRLPPDTALRLSEALGNPEQVDPVLPASPGLRPETPPTRQRLVARPGAALLNGAALAFLAAMALLYFRRLPPGRGLDGAARAPQAGRRDGPRR